METILVVEDEPALRNILDYNLKQAGYDVVFASSGPEAIERAQERHADLIILDPDLPDMSPAEICRFLIRNERTRGAPILIVSAKAGEADRIAGFELGAS